MIQAASTLASRLGRSQPPSALVSRFLRLLKRLPIFALLVLLTFSCASLQPQPRYHAGAKGGEVAKAGRIGSKPEQRQEKKKTQTPRKMRGSASAVVQHALKYIGVPYRYGWESASGMDCSGLVWRVWKDACGVEVPRVSRDQMRFGRPVNRSDMQPGDLVFFKIHFWRVDHVGIYLGDNQFLHASQSRGVRRANLGIEYWSRRWAGARRLPYSSK
jgi:cell wall-associated NlpC family hydrolase